MTNRPLAIVVIAATGLFAVTNIAHLLSMRGDGSSSHWEYLLNLLNSLLINVLAAYLLYVLVVHLPGLRRRSIIRNNLATHYRHFREDIVTNFLQLASERVGFSRIKELCDMHAFRAFFSQDKNARWYAVSNALYDNPLVMRDIVTELVLFRNELTFALSQVEIHDERIFGLLKRLSAAIYRVEQRKLEYDDVKAFMGLMWDVFAGWSVIDGYRTSDIVQDAIEGI